MTETNFTPEQVAQMVLANLDAIEHGVRRVTGPAGLGADVTADIVGDATLALLDKRGASFDPSRADAAGFCRMVAWQVALDKLRSMSRGGQFGGAYAGFGNANLDANHDDSDVAPVRRAPARSAHVAPTGAADNQPESAGLAVRVSGPKLNHGECFDVELAERQWTEQARAAVAEVLPELTATERALYALMMSGDFDPATYAAEHGVTTATAYVRANRLRSKLRAKLA